MSEYNDQNQFGQNDPQPRPEGDPERAEAAGEDSSRDAGQPGAPGDNWSSPSVGSWSGTGRPEEPRRRGPYQSQPQNRYGAPYSPNYHGNAYPPTPPRQGAGYGQNQGQQNQGYPPVDGRQPPTGQAPGEPGYDNRYPQQGYSPYQYNANSGWQQQPRQPEKYEWKFEDYERFDYSKKNGRKKPNRGLVVFTVALLGVLAAGLISLAGYSIYSSLSDNVAPEEGAAAEAPTGEAATDNSIQIAGRPEIEDVPAEGGKLSIPQVAEAVLPSVIGVIKYDNHQYYEISGYGSGIVMSADGYIITNAHVVAGGTGFKVQFTDGDAYDAEMVGYDTMTDLAVLKIEAADLVPAQFGDSDAVKVGETVIAIGNPAGMQLASSVTAGIVSAVNREVRTSNYNMTYIQTDAAINPGNSGGALANEYGQVIGINSSKIVEMGYEGIGFAIPITAAKPVIDDLIANGKVTGRVMLGITCRVVDEIDARNYGIQMGLMIDSVDTASDLSASGVLRGDILTHIDGERVYNMTDVRDQLDRYKPGDSVSLTLYRRIGTKEQTFDVTTRLMESA